MSRVRWWKRYDEMPVVELQKSNPVRFGVIVIVITAIVVYFGFTKHIPFKHGFRLKAVFATAVNISPKSPVRIARELDEFLERENVSRAADLVGTLKFETS